MARDLQRTRQVIVRTGAPIDRLVMLERIELFDENGDPFSPGSGGAGSIGPGERRQGR
jgi:hypothetical protein